MQYAVISDIHANYAALRSVVEDVAHLCALRKDTSNPIPFWFLGDLVGRGPDPVNCIKWLRNDSRIGKRWVPGNHDEWMVQEIAVNGDAKVSLEKHRMLLKQEENGILREWFLRQIDLAREGGKRLAVFEEHNGIVVGFTHGSIAPDALRWRYLWPWMLIGLQTEFMHLQSVLTGRGFDSEGPVLLFSGHTHFPMWARRREDGRAELMSIRYGEPMPLGDGMMLLNPGSVGSPYDGDPRAAYAIIDLDEKTVEFRRVTYPIAESTDLLFSEGYPDSLAERLRTGVANGVNGTDEYLRIYRRPTWDLEAISSG